MTNEELTQKAAITAADALATYGKLNPAQQDKFIDYLVQETVLKDNARVVKFRNEQLDIDKIGIGTRVAQPATEMVAPSNRRGVTTSKISLLPKEIIVPFEISDGFKELNIEGESVEDHIMKMFAKQLANDLETLYINGDTTGQASIEGDILDGGSTTQYVKDAFLALFNGWLRLADSGNVVDHAGTNIGLSVFGAMIRAMPTKFRRNKKDLRFFMSPDLAQIYIEKFATRMTPRGDSAAAGETQTPYGIPIVEVPLMALNPTVVEHVTLSGTTAVSLRYNPIVSAGENVLPSALSTTPTAAYTEGTDYDMDYTAGTIARNAGGSIGDGDVCKITYQANPQVILTHMDNFIIGIGRDLTLEKDRNIYKRGNEYCMHAKVSCQVEEVTALVKGTNIGTGV